MVKVFDFINLCVMISFEILSTQKTWKQVGIEMEKRTDKVEGFSPTITVAAIAIAIIAIIIPTLTNHR